MAEENGKDGFSVPGVDGEDKKVKTEEKTTGEKALEAIPFYGNVMKAWEAAGKTGETGGVASLLSEGSALITSFSEATQIATDPIGWLVNQGLSFLIAVVEPLEDLIHMVSGDGPALQQAGENFGLLAEGLTALRDGFKDDLNSSVQSWGGQSADAAATKLGEFANGIDGVIGQAGELSEMLLSSSMIMQIIEDLLKAILTELIIWMVMIWIPALAAAVPSFGSSTATAGVLTTARVATTASRMSRIVAKLRGFLDKIMDFLRNLLSRTKNVKDVFKKAMQDKRDNVAPATAAVKDKTGIRNLHQGWVNKMNSEDGIVGERVNQGFWKSMDDAVRTEGLAQIDPTNEKRLRSESLQQQGDEALALKTDYSKQQIKGYLDI